MPRKCNINEKCGPRTNWWKQTIGVDWYAESGSNPPEPPDDTTSDGKQAFLIIGDSIAGDTSSSTSLGPTTLSGTTYLWNGSSITELTTQDLNNAGATHGTMWKQFALDYNAGSGKKPVFINRASAGSEFYPNGDNNNWSTTGTLYSPSITEANECLSFLGITKLKGIFVILGINDSTGAQTLANIQTAVESLFSRLMSDFPDIPIYTLSIGRSSAGFINERIVAIKGYIKDQMEANADIHIVLNLTCFVDWAYYLGDGTHLTQPGNNQAGAMFSRYVQNSEANKVVRQIQNQFFNDLSANNKAAIKTFVEGCITDGNWDTTTMDSFQFYHPTDTRDKVPDWCLIAAARRRGTADGDGTNFYHSFQSAGNAISTNFAPVYGRKASQNDFIKGTRTGIVTTPAGTSGNLHSAASNMLLRSSASNVLTYASNGAADTWTGGDSQFQNNTDYANSRNGGTFMLFKNGVQVDSLSNSSSAPSTAVLQLGSIDSDANPIEAQYSHSFYARFTTFNHSAFLSRLSTLRSNWI